MRVVKRRDQSFVLPNQCSHVVRQKAVKAHVTDPQLVMTSLELLPILGAQCHRRMVTADSVLPVVGQRHRRAIRIAAKLDWFHLARSLDYESCRTTSAAPAKPENTIGAVSGGPCIRF